MAELHSKEARLFKRIYDHLIKSVEKEKYETRMMIQLSLINLPDVCKAIDTEPEARDLFMGVLTVVYADLKAYFKDEDKK